jgi:putative phosphoribosyl transferase
LTCSPEATITGLERSIPVNSTGHRVRFRDRQHAGRELARALAPRYGGRDDVVVLALPRGGVPVAYEVATALGAPLDVFVVRKVGVPGHEELAMGAIASGGVLVLDEGVLRALGISRDELQRAVATERRELQRREAAYRGSREPPELAGKTIILVDDGLATGATMKAAAEAVRKYDPAAIVVAVPVASAQTCDEFRHEIDDIVCLVTPEPFHAVGLWYEDFSPTSDEEVQDLLARASEPAEAASP